MAYVSSCLDAEISDLDLSSPVEASAEQSSRPADNVVPLPQEKRRAPQVYAFDYSGISAAEVKEVEATARRIRARLRAHTIETGRELLKVKGTLGHGKFGKWLDFHFGWKERTAQNYMNAASAFGSTPQVIDVLPPSTVYKLAAKSTPATLRQSVIDDINRGASLDPKQIEKRIAATKTDVRQKESADESIKPIDAPAPLHTSDGVTEETAITESAQARDSGVATSAPDPEQNADVAARQGADKRELAAKAIASLLRERLGNEFEKVRKAIFVIEPRVFHQALKEA